LQDNHKEGPEECTSVVSWAKLVHETNNDLFIEEKNKNKEIKE
jgi:hypothetical protein